MLEEADAAYDPAMVELLNDERKFCPRCESSMVLRMARKGSHAGETFWSCSRYPACDGKFST
ncbi:MAG: topoisomerase DNA-binding C4 zinc finger domain-containing protein [Verrucomicrobiales bacterium]|nr:topoisomerase DNA-binding C4 zinc finger domain-containing protein [Verrucomicrobiales bacterium]